MALYEKVVALMYKLGTLSPHETRRRQWADASAKAIHNCAIQWDEDLCSNLLELRDGIPLSAPPEIDMEEEDPQGAIAIDQRGNIREHHDPEEL